MSQLSFVTDLSDAYEEVRSKAKNGKQTIKALIDYFEGRLSAEEAFVKSLSKLPSTDEDFQEQSTVLCAWKSIYETNSVHIQGHLNYIKTLKEEVIPSLKSLLDDLRNTKKKLENMEKISTKRKVQYELDLQKAKDDVARSTEEVNAAIQAIEEKAKSGKAVNDSDNQMISQSAEKSAHCEELAKKVEETTQKYMEEYKHTIGEIMNTFQEVEEKRINTIKDVLSKQALAQKNLDDSSLESSKRTEELANGIDATHDVAELIVALREIVQQKAQKKAEEPQEARSPPPPPPKSRFFGLLGQSKSHTPTSEEDHKPSLPVKPLPVKPLPAKPAAPAKPALPSKALPPRPLPAKPVPSRALPAKPLPPRPPLPGKMTLDPQLEQQLTASKETIYGESSFPTTVDSYWVFDPDSINYAVLFLGLASEGATPIPEGLLSSIKEKYHLEESLVEEIRCVFGLYREIEEHSKDTIVSSLFELLPALRNLKANELTMNLIVILKAIYTFLFSSLLWNLKQSAKPAAEKQKIYTTVLLPQTEAIKEYLTKLEQEVQKNETEAPLPLPEESVSFETALMEMNKNVEVTVCHPMVYHMFEDCLAYRYQESENLIVVMDKPQSKEFEFYIEISNTILHLSKIEYNILNIKQLMNLYMNCQKSKKISDLLDVFFNNITEAFKSHQALPSDTLLLTKLSYQLVNPCKNSLKDAISVYSTQSSFVTIDLEFLKRTLLIQQYCHQSKQSNEEWTTVNPLNDDLLHTLIEGSAMMYYMSLVTQFTAPYSIADAIELMHLLETAFQETSPEMVVLNEFSTIYSEAKSLFIRLVLNHASTFCMDFLEEEPAEEKDMIALLQAAQLASQGLKNEVVDFCEEQLKKTILPQFKEVESMEAFCTPESYQTTEPEAISEGAKEFLCVFQGIYDALLSTDANKKYHPLYIDMYYKEITTAFERYCTALLKTVPVPSSLSPVRPIPPNMLQQTKDISSGFKNFINKVRRPSMSQNRRQSQSSIGGETSKPSRSGSKIIQRLSSNSEAEPNSEAKPVDKNDTKELEATFCKLRTVLYLQEQYPQTLSLFASLADAEEMNSYIQPRQEAFNQTIHQTLETLVHVLCALVVYQANKEVFVNWLYQVPTNTVEIAINSSMDSLDHVYNQLPEEFQETFKQDLFDHVSESFINSLTHNKYFMSRGSYVWQYCQQHTNIWKDLNEEQNKIITDAYMNDNKMITLKLEDHLVGLSLSDYLLKDVQNDNAYHLRKRYTSVYSHDYDFILNFFFNNQSHYSFVGEEKKQQFINTIQSIFVYVHMTTAELIRQYRFADQSAPTYLSDILLERDDPHARVVLSNKN